MTETRESVPNARQPLPKPGFITLVVFLAAFPGMIGGGIPLLLLHPAFPSYPDSLGAWRYAGLGVIVAGLTLFFWCVAQFWNEGRGTPAPYAPPRELVVRGAYRWTRNPMYIGLLAIILGEALLFAQPALLYYTAFMWLAFHLRVLLYEESVLREQFGKSFDDYTHHVPRWWIRRPWSVH